MADIEITDEFPGPHETQYNFARVNAFRLIAVDLPGVDFYCQMVAIPSLRMQETSGMDTPLNEYPLTGTKVNYGELMVTFLVDEKFYNYRSVHNWLIGITFPQSHSQFTNLLNTKKKIFSNVKSPEAAIRSDIDLMVLDSMNTPIATYKFRDAFPTSMEHLPFDVTITDVNYFTVVATFKFSYYEISEA